MQTLTHIVTRTHNCIHIPSYVLTFARTLTLSHSDSHALALSRTHTRTHLHSHALTLARPHTRTHTHWHALTLARTHTSTHTSTHSRSHSLTLARTHTRTHSHSHALTLARTLARTLSHDLHICTCVRSFIYKVAHPTAQLHHAHTHMYIQTCIGTREHMSPLELEQRKHHSFETRIFLQRHILQALMRRSVASEW